ncbi:DUF4184 family protein [Pseudomonas sp. F1_0610]|uniref:DUF4184 family protein n=1 Tax=Pseudomonas sp. F1_0610 TaxID=3114284 RepID=UPI0039C1C22D
MPWTLAHPAAVIPIRLITKKLPLPALIIGSLTPDAGYYIKAFAFANQAHTWVGLVSHCLPVGLVLLIIILLLRQAFLVLLPATHRLALSATYANAPKLSGSYIFCVMLALVLGAATHIIWDSFTHASSDLLSKEIMFYLQDRAIRWYNLLQFASSLLGTLVLVSYYIRWLSKQPPHDLKLLDRWEKHRYVWLFILAGSALFYGFLVTDYFSQEAIPFYRIYFHWILNSSLFFALAYLVSSLIAYGFHLHYNQADD